jgi:hypothetical protein
VLKNSKTSKWVKRILFFVPITLFIAYLCTSQNPSPLMLCLGSFVVIPVTLVPFILLLGIMLSQIAARLYAKKQFRPALQCALYGSKICACYANVYKAAGNDNPFLPMTDLRNLSVISHCLSISGKMDEAVAVGKQLVEAASADGFNCIAARGCENLAHLFREAKDEVHARHWTERALSYFARLSGEGCSCRTGHSYVLGQYAALQARLALDSQSAGSGNAAQIAASKAEEILGTVDPADGELALRRLIDFYLNTKDWEKLDGAGERVL